MLGFSAQNVGELTEAQLAREVGLLAPRAVERAERSAISRTLSNVRTEISKTVRRDLALKARTVTSVLKLDRRRGEITVKARAVPLKEYGASRARRWVSVRVKKSRGRRRVAGGFMPMSLGGHVFKRVGRARLPIKKLFGPSVVGELSKHTRHIEQFGRQRFEHHMASRLRWEVQKFFRRRSK